MNIYIYTKRVKKSFLIHQTWFFKLRKKSKILFKLTDQSGALRSTLVSPFSDWILISPWIAFLLVQKKEKNKTLVHLLVIRNLECFEWIWVNNVRLWERKRDLSEIWVRSEKKVNEHIEQHFTMTIKWQLTKWALYEINIIILHIF